MRFVYAFLFFAFALGIYVGAHAAETTQQVRPFSDGKAVTEYKGWAASTAVERTDGLGVREDEKGKILGGTNCMFCGDRVICGAIGSNEGLFGYSANSKDNRALVYSSCATKTQDLIKRRDLSPEEKEIKRAYEAFIKEKVISPRANDLERIAQIKDKKTREDALKRLKGDDIGRVTFDYKEIHDKAFDIQVSPLFDKKSFTKEIRPSVEKYKSVSADDGYGDYRDSVLSGPLKLPSYVKRMADEAAAAKKEAERKAEEKRAAEEARKRAEAEAEARRRAEELRKKADHDATQDAALRAKCLKNWKADFPAKVIQADGHVTCECKEIVKESVRNFCVSKFNRDNVSLKGETETHCIEKVSNFWDAYTAQFRKKYQGLVRAGAAAGSTPEYNHLLEQIGVEFNKTTGFKTSDGKSVKPTKDYKPPVDDKNAKDRWLENAKELAALDKKLKEQTKDCSEASAGESASPSSTSHGAEDRAKKGAK